MLRDQAVVVPGGGPGLSAAGGHEAIRAGERLAQRVPEAAEAKAPAVAATPCERTGTSDEIAAVPLGPNGGLNTSPV